MVTVVQALPEPMQARTPTMFQALGNRFATFVYGFAVIVLVLITAVVYQNINAARDHARWVARTQQVQMEIGELVSLSSHARIAWLSFLTTGNGKQAEDYVAAAKAIPSKMQSLKDLTTDNLPQQQKLARFSSLVSRDIAAMSEGIRQKAAGSLVKPADVLAQLSSVALRMDELTTLAGEMKASEKYLLSQRVAQSEESAERMILFVVVGNIASLLVLLLAFGLFRREAQQRKTVEQALRKSEEHFRSLAQSANDAVISANSRGNIVYWNSGARKIFGYPEEDILGQSVTRLMPERYREAHLQGMQRFLATGDSSVIGKTIELFALRNDDTEFPMELSLARWESHGNIFFTAMIRDITARKRAEDELRRSEERFRLMVESVTDYAIFMLDTEGYIVSWNAGAERINGYRTEEILGQHCSRLYLREDVEGGKPQHELGVATATGRFEDEGWRLRKDGSTFWATVIITAMRDHSSTLRGFVKVTRDLTERKLANLRIRDSETRLQALNANLELQAAELQSANQALQAYATQLETTNQELESFTYTIAHDLRSPMRAIIGFSRLIEDGHLDRLDAEGKRLLRIIRDNGSKMGQLIDDLLAFSRLGRHPLNITKINMFALAREVLKELREKTRDCPVETIVMPMSPAQGDQALIRQVWVNLLSNAFKFTRQKEQAVIELGEESANPESANLENVYYVKDNGAGFDMRYYDKLFGVFQRLHATDQYSGTGVGLAIVHKVVARHGGRVWAEGKVDEGATFYFALPHGGKNG